MLKHNKDFNHTKGKKHGQCHVRGNFDFNNHNTARNETLSLKRKAPRAHLFSISTNIICYFYDFIKCFVWMSVTVGSYDRDNAIVFAL